MSGSGFQRTLGSEFILASFCPVSCVIVQQMKTSPIERSSGKYTKLIVCCVKCKIGDNWKDNSVWNKKGDKNLGIAELLIKNSEPSNYYQTSLTKTVILPSRTKKQDVGGTAATAVDKLMRLVWNKVFQLITNIRPEISLYTTFCCHCI